MRIKFQCRKLGKCIGKCCKIAAKPALFLLLAASVLSLMLLVGVLSISAAVRDKAEGRIQTPAELSDTQGVFDCIIVLGCGLTADGEPSPMLMDRLETAIELYFMGVSDTILMSGDHRTDDYNEVGAMRRVALERGVPEHAIILDRAGLSTYDSIARLHAEYGIQRAVIVTQEYHLYRALYIAEKLGVEAYGVSASRQPYSNQAFRNVREAFARCKDVLFALQRPPYATVSEQ